MLTRTEGNGAHALSSAFDRSSFGCQEEGATEELADGNANSSMQQIGSPSPSSASQRTMGTAHKNGGASLPRVVDDLLRGRSRVSTSPGPAPVQEHGGVVSGSLFTPTQPPNRSAP